MRMYFRYTVSRFNVSHHGYTFDEAEAKAYLKEYSDDGLRTAYIERFTSTHKGTRVQKCSEWGRWIDS